MLGINGTENRVKVTRVLQVFVCRAPSSDIFQSIGGIPQGTELAPRY
jgi:hypothetical protein